WTSSSNAFLNAAVVRALAFDNAAGTFVAASSIPNITWANAADVLNDTTATSNFWHDASLPNASVLESYRGLTLISRLHMAVCGIRGDIRTSGDGGRTWSNAKRNGIDIVEPDLLSIASDGVKLVAVGAGGRIFYSGDAANNWAI